ncbi:MAG TPA: peptidase G2 autoproteolytic cleavage domain-containing protein, partial [Bacillales bacterium]|nr:peptidase G2 autoproteolytic cleavage domain-containing protein [Bacillales bacterium]
ASHAYAADTATNAAHATEAGHAANADEASHALNADNAIHATNADTATNANHANTADMATNATHATEANHAANADNASMLNGLASNQFLRSDTSGSLSGSLAINGNLTVDGDSALLGKVTEGSNTTASGANTHAEGNATTAKANESHAEGLNATAGISPTIGVASHVEGQGTKTEANNAHAEGLNTTANGTSSHAEGEGNTASGRASHAEGGGVDGVGNPAPTTASGSSSHAEGAGTTASGYMSHAEGFGTIASGGVSHAEGNLTIADREVSHAEGSATSTNGKPGVHIMGVFGAADDLDFSWYLANGTTPYDPAGIVAKILSNGSACFEGTLRASAITPGTVACDFAEMFETSDGAPIDIGYFVTFDGASKKIRKAHSQDDYILGITSSNPAILTDTDDPDCSKFVFDEWNRPVYEKVTIPAVKDKNEHILIEQRTETRRKINPNWDPEQHACASRLERQEWAAVGLVGKLLIRDDGSCKPGGYCKPNDEGIATNANQGYRVMDRTGSNQILILVNSTLQFKQENHSKQLQRLAKLKKQGVLTEEEFRIEKQKIIDTRMS